MTAQLLVCTDLDRTLIPNGNQPESPSARALFQQFVSRTQVTLAYVTGRDSALVRAAIAEYELPLPDFVIADVGSSLYTVKKIDQWLRCQDWDDKIAVDWQHETPANLGSLLADLIDQNKGCRIQEPERQGLYKLSYYIPLDLAVENLVAAIKARLTSQQVQANLIWSIDEQSQIGLLDILPLGANKREAIAYLMDHQRFNLKNTVFSGDSGNDLAVLLSPIKSILVANASQQLKEKVQSEIDRTGVTDSLYIAQGGYQNLNGNYSAGILEGIAHYFPEVQIYDK